jgi:DNA-directed RNA polymerase sigma subunit (sigma70/sigma32)
VNEPTTDLVGGGGAVPPIRPFTRSAGGDENGPLLLPHREALVLSILWRPLIEGEASPATIDAVADELGVTPQRVEQILRSLYRKFGVPDEDESRVARFALAAVRRGHC